MALRYPPNQLPENGNVVNNYTSFDGDGRITASNVQLQGVTYNFTYGYDLAGDLTNEVYPSGRTVNTTFDFTPRPLTMNGVAVGATTNYVQSSGYYPDGHVQFWQYGSNLWSCQNVDNMLRSWQAWATMNNNGNNWLFYAYNGFDTNSDVISGNEGFGPAVPFNSMTFFNDQYQYDGLKRLLKITDTNYSRQYSWDAFGNPSLTSGLLLSGLTPQSTNGSNPYNPANNRLVANVYEARGNMTSLGAVTMGYDAERASLDFFNARTLSAPLGAFIQPDPGNAGADITNPQSWNGYAYVLGNPLGLVDPSGMNCITLDNGASADDGQGTPCPGSTDPDILNVFSGSGPAVALSFGYYQSPSGGGGGGGTTSKSPTQPPAGAPAKNGQTCPSVPAHPSNANISANIAAASSRNPVNGGVNPQSASYVSPASTLAWFNAQVKYGGPWDYKRQGSQFEDFGNFNYGATGVAAGFDASTLLRAAGYAQRHHPQSAQFPGDPGNPLSILFNQKGGTPPYGDNPQNQQLILLGIQYAKNGC